MSLESLLEAVRADAEARRTEIRERARSEAARIVERAREAARRRRADHRRRLEEEAHAAAAERMAEARREARARILSARSRGLERIFDEARARLPSVGASEAYREVLPVLLSAAFRPLGGRPGSLRCAPGLGRPIRDLLDEAGVVDGAEGGGPSRGVEVSEDPSVEAGLVVSDPDVGLEVDATLAAALRSLRPGLAIELVERVEGAAAPPEDVGDRPADRAREGRARVRDEEEEA